eukprot:Gb_03980 [translate_table: standard]
MVVAAMDPEIKADIEKTVLEILEDADMAEMTEYKARKLAGNKLGMNLSEPHYKKFIRSIIENFLKSREEAQAEEEQAKEEVEAEAAKEEEEEEEEEEEKRPRKQSKKAGTVRQSKQAELQQTSKDDIGDLIICWKLKQGLLTWDFFVLAFLCVVLSWILLFSAWFVAWKGGIAKANNAGLGWKIVQPLVEEGWEGVKSRQWNFDKSEIWWGIPRETSVEVVECLGKEGFHLEEVQQCKRRNYQI